MRRAALLFMLFATVPAYAETGDDDPRAALTDLIGPPRYHECLSDVDLGNVSLPGAEQAKPGAVRRLVVVLDGSGLMAGAAGGTSKMAAAQDATIAMLRDMPTDVSVGLVAFGHKGNNTNAGKAASCAGIQTLYEPGAADPVAIERAVRTVKATGWTPLAAAIEHAGAMLEPTDKAGEQVVWVVSDGKETCGGDAIAAARKLHASETKAVINIVGYDLPARDRSALQAVAQAGGREFVEVRANESLSERMRGALERAAKASHATQVMINANKATAVNARNDAMSCFVRQRDVEQKAFTAFRMVNGVSKSRSKIIVSLCRAVAASVELTPSAGMPVRCG